MKMIKKKGQLGNNTSVAWTTALYAGLLTLPLSLAADSDHVVLEELPEAVRDALDSAAPGIIIDEIELDSDDPEALIYEIEGEWDGREIELEISGLGEVLEVESEDEDDEEDEDDNEQSLTFEELPENIADIVLALFPNIVPDEVEREEEDGVVVYEIEGLNGEDEVSVEIAESGEVLELESELGLSAVPGLPEAVQEALSTTAAGAVIQEFKSKSRDGNQIYKFEGILNDQELELSIAADGVVLSVESEARDNEDREDDDNEQSLTFEELPESIADIVLALFPNLVPDEVEREEEDGVVVYEVEGFNGADEVSVEIAESGEVLELESELGFSSVPGLPEAVQEALSATAADAVIQEFKSKSRGDNQIYKFEGILNDQELELSIAADGMVLSVDFEAIDSDEEEHEHEEEITFEQLPEPVRAAIASTYPSFHFREIELETTADGDRYEIEGCLEDGQALELLFAANGELVRMEVDSDDDGLCDADEIEMGSDPDDRDSDDDIFPDGFEVGQSSNPTDPNSQPQILSVSLVESNGVKAFDVCVETFAAGIYQLEEHQEGGNWLPIGEPFNGDGESCNVVVSMSDAGLGIFRVMIQSTAVE